MNSAEAVRSLVHDLIENTRDSELRKIKTITSHAGYARHLADTEEEPVGYLGRHQTAHIPSPYHHSSSHPIYNWNGKPTVSFETRHKRFEVYEVPHDMHRYATDDEATDAYITHLRAKKG